MKVIKGLKTQLKQLQKKIEGLATLPECHQGFYEQKIDDIWTYRVPVTTLAKDFSHIDNIKHFSWVCDGLFEEIKQKLTKNIALSIRSKPYVYKSVLYFRGAFMDVKEFESYQGSYANPT